MSWASGVKVVDFALLRGNKNRDMLGWNGHIFGEAPAVHGKIGNGPPR